MAKRKSKNRIDSLKDLVGESKADEVRRVAREAQAKLDEVGVERKQFKLREVSPDEVAVIAEVAAAAVVELMPPEIVETLVTTMAVGDDAAVEDVLANVIEEAIVDAIDASGEVPVEAPAEGAPSEEAALSHGHGERGLSNRETKELLDTITSLKQYIVTQTKEAGDIGEAQLEMAQSMKSMADFMPDLVKRLEKLEGKMALRPRQASRSSATEFESAVAEAEARKSIEPAKSTFLGLPVKEGNNGNE